MIYTITTNPSLDYYVKIKDLKVGTTNRSEGEDYDAAGKGVNVSKVLNDMNISSIALGFLGGYNKDHYLDLLAKYDKIQPQFIMINDNTRINIKIDGDKETSLNALGPKIEQKEWDRFVKRLDSIFDNDYVVLSGNVQDDLSNSLIAAMKDLIDNNVKVILDTDEDIVLNLLEKGPYLIKMTGDMSEEELFNKAKEYIEKGSKYVMYSSYHKPAYLFKEDEYYVCEDFKSVDESFIGANDTMIAGLLYASLKAATIYEAFLYANSLTLTLKHMDDEVDFNVVDAHYKELEIKRLSY